MLRPGGLSALYTLRMPPLFCARAPPPAPSVTSTPISAASNRRLRGISLSPIRMPGPADLFVSGAASLPDILRIPGWLVVIFRPWGSRGNDISIAADPLTAKNAETLDHAGLELSGSPSSRRTSAVERLPARASRRYELLVTRMFERLVGMSNREVG